ncbi:MAG: methionine biosynthesis protein MetW [Nitrospiraceae bacterium]|nr:methionine biosynthesis protein MetW [Nitrospiraceae bacterium]
MKNNLDSIRADHRIILEMIETGSSVLDLGCGNGELLSLLIREKAATGHGIEIDEKAIYQCVARGVAVSHGDIDTGLSDYRSRSFDYVILNQSLQQVIHVDSVLQDALRVGRSVIVGFPNFAYYKSRLQIFFCGRTPVTGAMPFQWFETPNLHFLSITDFVQYCAGRGINISKAVYLGEKRGLKFFPNLFAQTAIFVLSRKDYPDPG